MLKILGEDKAMVEQLNYDQLPAEYRWGGIWSLLGTIVFV
jgi:hypothetical protein